MGKQYLFTRILLIFLFCIIVIKKREYPSQNLCMCGTNLCCQVFFLWSQPSGQSARPTRKLCWKKIQIANKKTGNTKREICSRKTRRLTTKTWTVRNLPHLIKTTMMRISGLPRTSCCRSVGVSFYSKCR